VKSFDEPGKKVEVVCTENLSSRKDAKEKRGKEKLGDLGVLA